MSTVNINDLLTNQQQASSAIESVYTNFKKDGADRKTADYIKRRLELLDNYWLEYESIFSQLSVSQLEPHLTEQINQDKERVYERYGNIRAHILNYPVPAELKSKTPIIKPPAFITKPSGSDQALNQDIPMPPARGSAGAAGAQATSVTVSKTEEMLRKQSSNFKAFHRTVTGINLESVNEKWEFEDLLHTVQSRWAAIDSLHWDLDSLLDGSNQEYERTFSAYESKYQEIKKAINKKMWSVSHMEKATPQMDIPTFSGNYNNWTSFKDLFVETIHNNRSMSNAQKMQYLKSKVKGEAERSIQHLHVSSDNYEACWNILNHRYNNKKSIFNSHMNNLMNLPVMQHQSVPLLKRMYDTTQECMHAIRNLGADISSWDPIIVYLISQKLDTASHEEYSKSVKNPRELPNLQELLDFLETKFINLETSRRKQDTPTQKNQPVLKHQNTIQNRPTYYKSSFTSSKLISQPVDAKQAASSSKYTCSLCHSTEHGIYFCRKFLEMPSYNRMKTVTKLNLCPNCLFDHQGRQCLSDKVCRECNQDHNSLLHEAFAQPPARPTTQAAWGVASARGGDAGDDATVSANAGKQVRSSTHVSLHDDPIEVLLPTAMIRVQAYDGSYHVMRALLDQGSQTSLITEHAAQLLKLPRNKCNGIISGVGDKESNCKGIITIKCLSTVSDFSFETDALIMKQLIKNLPTQSFPQPDWSYLDHIKLADPEFNKSRPVDILLGADIYSIVLMDGICRANSTLPTAQQTRLGWILSGNAKTFQCNVVLHNIEDSIQQFRGIEDISEQSDLSSEDKQCAEFYQSTTTRRDEDRYEVGIPLKSDYQKKLGNSKSKAVTQFYNLERKLIRNPSIANENKKFIDEYLALGHMTPAVGDCNTTLKCYLPHHCVTREESTTTKLRAVFNDSNKTALGLSLNDAMCRGPNLQQDLQSPIIKWRQNKYAFTAEIEKTFRQIWINSEDQYLQMIVWRNNPNSRLQEFQLATVTYGTKAAPFFAMVTLKQLAHDEKKYYQNSSAPSVLEESLYMDDLIHGSSSIQSAKKLQKGCASRGLSTSQLKLPTWLPTYEPGKEILQNIFSTNVDIKSSKQVNVMLSSENDILHQNQHEIIKKKEETSNQKGEKSYQPQRKVKKISFATMAISLLLFFITVPSVNSLYQITSIQGNNSLYFDRIKDMHLIRDDWRLVVYYDTGPYQAGNTALAMYIKYLDDLCMKIKAQSHCEGIMLQLRHEVTELEYYNGILMNHNANTQNKRRRRGLINGVGYLANRLFGVLDERFAEKYEQDINLIKDNQKHLASLWKNQTSVVEAEFNLLKRTESIIDKHYKLINKNFNAVEKAVNQIQTACQNASLISDFLSTAMIANSMVFSLKNIQQTLLDAVTNVYNGKFNFHLLTPDQLRHELGVISEQLPKDLSLPVKKSDSLSEMYNLMQVRARVTASFIIFEIKIPLIGEDRYEILKLIPIPHLADNGIEVEIVPVAEYVAVNLQHDAFMEITVEDLRSCLQRSPELDLCHFKRPIYVIKDDQSFCETLPKSRKCKTITRLCNNRWVELSKINTYLYSCCEQCQLDGVIRNGVNPQKIVN